MTKTVRARWPCAPLRKPLTAAQRKTVATQVGDLITWQRTLARWPKVASATRGAPDATTFVSIYADGVLRGCFGSVEGEGAARLTRAFLRALEDSRYGMVRAAERERLDVLVSYVRELRIVDPARITEEIEPGTDGLALAWDDRPAVLLLPGVARDQRVGTAELLTLLLRKSGVADASTGTLFAFRTDDVLVRASGPVRASRPDPRRLAVRWLEGLVGPDGEVTFGVDPRKRIRLPGGMMHHGRAAVVVRALAREGSRLAARANAWLERSIATALHGGSVAGWPTDPGMVAGTLALARMAGADVEVPLLAVSTLPALREAPWYAAQVVAALGRKAPAALWEACVADLEARPWAPWTLLAARALRDMPVVKRTSRALVESIRTRAPHAGGCGRTPVPELALTALVVEALDGLPGASCKAAVKQARAFLAAWQLLPATVPASLDPALSIGAYPASPVIVDHLRCDITAHAVLAMPSR